MKKYLFCMIPLLLASPIPCSCDETGYKFDRHFMAAGGKQARPRVSVGTLDAIYPEEARIIIDDRSYLLTEDSRFTGEYSESLSIDTLETGRWVSFEYQWKPHGVYILKSLRVMSNDEINKFANDKE